MSSEENIRKAQNTVITGCRSVVAKGYVLGTAGNISARVCGTNYIAITPAGSSFEMLEMEDIPIIDMDGKAVFGKRKPSSEFEIHCAIYKRRSDVNSILHTHSKFSTAISSVANIDKIPYIDIEMILQMGGEILVAPFAFPGSCELARVAADALGIKMCVMLKHHGNVCVGSTMRKTIDSCDNLERTCEMYLAILQTGLKIDPIPDSYIAYATQIFEKRRAPGVAINANE
jgi:ribulose-5-phosphate 4-epimerase/fuculose-1-phosphate aldolase